MEKNKKVISQIILGQSLGSVRIVIALFTLGATVTKLLYDYYLPNLIDFDEVRWGIIGLGCVFFLSTFFTFRSSVFIAYLSFFVYLCSLGYALAFVLINRFDPSAVTILILIMGASTIIINNLTYYGVQSGLIVITSFLVFLDAPLPTEHTLAFYNLLIAAGVFAIVIIVRLKLISSVKHSYANLEKLQVLSIVANKNGEIIYISSSVHSLLGYEPRELIKNGWWQSGHLSKSWISREQILNYPNIMPRELLSMECSVITKDGKVKWLTWANSVLPNGNYMGIAQDITKYKTKEGLSISQ
jgi:PAS domain S-box-containing protein